MSGALLSSQQRQLWRQQCLSGAGPFRTHCRVLVEGELDRALLQAALEDRVARHDLLRCQILAGPDGEARVEVAPAPGRLLWEDGSSGTGDPGMVLRAGLEDLGPGLCRLHLDLPSLWADARGLESLVREVARTCGALAQGTEPPSVPVQFGVLARWQNEILDSEDGGWGRQFWARQDLAALTARLPWEDVSAAGRPFSPRSVMVSLPPEVAANLARAVPGVALPDILQACWQVLLWRLAGGSEVVVGTACSGRAYGEVEEVVGPFAKDLPIRLPLNGAAPFSAVASELAGSLAEALDWQEYFTWDPLQRAVGEAGSLFFPFSFEYRTLPAPFESGGLRFRVEASGGCYDRFRVRLSAREEGGSLVLELLHDESVLAEADATRLAEQLSTLAAAVAAVPRRPVGELPLLGRGERRLLLDLAVTPAPLRAVSRRGALRPFEQRATSAPEHTAVIVGSEIELSYGELDARANQLARYLSSLGVRPGNLVGAFLGRSSASPVVILGILKAGAAYVPLDPAYPAQRLERMLADSGVRWMVCEKEPDGLQLPASLTLILLDREAEAIARQARDEIGLDLVPESPAYVMYTSGSTGEPRGVVVTHGCLAHYVEALQARIGLEPGDRWLHTASMAFSSSARQLFVPLSHGAAVVVAGPEQRVDPEALFREIRERGVTVVDLVPSFWRGCLHAIQALPAALRESLVDNRLRLILSASEPLLSQVAAAWSEILGGRVRFINMYGQTETTGIVATHPIPPDRNDGGGVAPAGRPIPGTAVYLLESGGDLALMGTPGELCVGGSGVGQGYLGRPAETAERFVPDPFSGDPGARLYRTGDLGRQRSDGTVEFLGRRDQQIKIRGIRIELGEVEAALGRHEAVREAVVGLYRDEATGRECLVGYIVPQGASPEPEELRGFLRRSLPEPMIPAAFVALETLPLTPNGKLDRRALPVPGSEADTAYVAPRDEMERRLADIWGEMLGLDRVGVSQSFFSLGGHSLLASLVVSRVRDAFDVELPVLALFRSPTVAGLAQEVRQALDSTQTAATLGVIVPLQSMKEKELPSDLEGLSDEQVSALLARLLAAERSE